MDLKYYIPDLNKDYRCKNCFKLHSRPYPNLNCDMKCNVCSSDMNKLSKRYVCDFCQYDGPYEGIYKIDDKQKDACDKCISSKNLVELTDRDKLIKRSDTICYRNEFHTNMFGIDIYVIYEYDNVCGCQHCEYYLLCIKNNKIILNYIIDTYNSYFGVEVLSVEVVPDLNEITIKYQEKHYVCNVTLEFDVTSEETNYSNNGLYDFKPIGKVIEFKKNNVIMPSKRYF